MKIVNFKAKTNYQLGKEISEQTQKSIEKAIKNATWLSKIDQEKYKKIKKITEKKFPELIEELKGMSEGANIPFETILKFNIKELIPRKINKHPIDEDCTTLTLKNENNTIIAHNEDGNRHADLFIYKGTLPSGIKVLGTGYPGQLIGFATTITSNEIYFSANTLSCRETGIGIPKRFITRKAIEYENIQELLKFLKKINRAQGQNYTIHQKEETYNLEASTKAHKITKIKERFAHCNNFIHQDLLKFENRPPSHPTHYRNFVAQHLITQAKNEKDLIKILANRKYAPKSICMLKKDTKQGIITLGSTIYKSSEPNKLIISTKPTNNPNYEQHII